MKKILLSVLCVNFLAAKPYIGIKMAGNFLNVKAKVSGIATNTLISTPSTNMTESYGRRFPLNISPLSVGLIGGYAFAICDRSKLWFEGDVGFARSSDSIKNFSVDAQNKLSLLRENVQIKRSALGYGIQVLLSYDADSWRSVLFGVRFGADGYKVTASHTNTDGVTIRDENQQTKNAYVWNITPKVGISFRVKEDVHLRLFAGYQFSKNKKVVTNYLQHTTFVSKNNTASVSIAPRGLVISAVLLREF